MADGQAAAGGRRRFDEETLGLLAESEQVDVEAGSGARRLPPRTIWIVADDGDVYIRSYKGAAGRWYLRALADGRATLVAGRRRIPVELHAVTDRSVVAAVSEAYRTKYARRSPYETDVMLQSDSEAAMLRVEPSEAPAAGAWSDGA